jgi:DNA helicase-2/ATP-dependent DNA helicase PcrA
VAASRTAHALPASSPQGEGKERSGAFLKRAEVRDVLAWLRLLVDPQDAAAVVRALARPPIELRQVELARVIQVARRRKLDLVLGLAAATESPHVPPEARERIQRFVLLHASAAAELDSAPPDVFLARLIELLRGRSRSLLAPRELAEQRADLERLQRLAVDYVRATPLAGARELARHLATVVPDAGDAPDAQDVSYAQDARDAQGESDARDVRPRFERATSGEGESPPLDAGVSVAHHANSDLEDLHTHESDRELHAALELLREEVLAGVGRIGGRLGELRLDTDLDISHGVVRYLELLKVSALLQRPAGQSLADALADVNARLLAAVTPLQREILLTSTLDHTLAAAPDTDGQDADGTAAARAGQRARESAVAPREQHSLVPFLPRKGIGLALSASDIHTYRSCPLRYKYARVLRIPTEQTIHQRFGIVVHQVLERYHSDGGATVAQMLDLLDTCWRRGGFAESEPVERELLEKARAALTHYHARLESQDSQPVWFERQFHFRLGPHHLRGRVDRVDRLGEGEDAEYELIDYKTSRPKSAEQLRDDVQLSLYALAAREDWRLPSSRQAYYYVLDDLKVPVPRDERDAQAVEEVVLEVGEGILAQAFEPTPSPGACSLCDYRIVCPAAEG